MPKVMPITSALVAALAAAPGAVAQVTSSQDSVVSPWPVGREPTVSQTAADTGFIRQVIYGNATEVALGRLADSRADNDEVEDFAERMVADHNAMNAEWTDLARDNDMKVTVDFGPTGRQTIERLEDLSGSEFDQAYMSEMIRHHEQSLADLQRMATAARTSEVRALASSGASTVREHLTLARQVGSRVGISTTAGRAGGVTTPLPAPSRDSEVDDRQRRTTVGRTTTANADDRDDRDDRTVRATLRREDRAFVENVLSDHLMHVRLAKQARREAGSPETRSLAERIEKDFGAWAQRWERFADRRNANVTSRLERHNREKLERLEKASERKDFDRAYAAIVADHLDMMVDDYREEKNEDRPGAVRRLIEDELPVLREHLARARRLERQADDRK
jgi:putative membrane protein